MRKLVIAMTLLCCACGAPTPDSGPRRITVPECDDTASCILAIEIDGEFWTMDCTVLRPDSVSEDVVAVGGLGVFVDEARPIEGIDPDAVLAAHVIGEECGGFSGDSGEWVIARGASGDNESHAMSAARAICEHGMAPTEYDLCDQGGRIQWFTDEGTEALSIHYSYFPEHQEEVESALRAGDPGHAWRTDATEVATRFWLRENASLCLDEFSVDFYPRCRVGLAPATINDGTATVEFALQWASPVNVPEETLYETYAQTLTLESTGGAWWGTGFVEQPSTQDGFDEEGRSASDAFWAACCRIVLIDNETGVAPPVTPD